MATLTPAGGPSQGLILLIPDQGVSGDARVWFATAVKQLSSDGPVTDQSEIETPSGTSMLIKAVTVKLAQGVQQRLYTAVLSGKTATLYVLVAPSSAAMNALTPALTALIKSTPGSGTGGTAPSVAGASLLGKKTPMPAIKPQNAAQFMAAGGDPETQIIPDEFRCYQVKKGSSLTPELAVQVLPGGKYRTPYGSGSVSVRKDSSLVKLSWHGGPLDGADGYLNFGHHGQALSLNNVGEDVLEDDLSFECYQRGPRENLAVLEFKLKTPAVASYACTLKDSGKSSGVLEILADGQYRLNGQAGRYSSDFRSDQDQSWSDLEFTGGALNDATGSYSESQEGVREISVYRPGLRCTGVVKPTPIPRYGAARAAPAPQGSGGLSGPYVHWYADPMAAMGYGGCGGLCWDVRVFSKTGYVFTNEPDASLDEADCTRTHPNGLPVCETYRIQNGKITIGKGKPEPFKTVGRALEINGDTYQPMLKLEGVKLAGAYTAQSFVGGGMGSTVSGAFQNTLNFLPGNKFSRERSGGVSATFTDTGTSSGNVTGGFASTNQSAASGTYSVKGYTLTLTYGDGHQEQMFAFVLPDKNGKPDLDLLRLGGSSYTVPKK
ncbi:lipocalin family protein [Deinococcus humi]|uniref:Lipocalin-like domain-containing protein n=1 Tax=Deinococcus humi TaxID=662880 RepID=A0A7W8JVE5_9DEIO|nr:lipocalin family protein [Deinococcus humi]MBB5363844.1 hypothetical protein [Deinococcus humi]